MDNDKLRISELAEGELQQKLDYEIKKILNNIYDEATPATTTRELTLKIKFTPDTNREKVNLDFDIKTKLANVIGVSTTVATQRNQNTGRIEVHELKSNIPGQTYFDDKAELRLDTGQPVTRIN